MTKVFREKIDISPVETKKDRENKRGDMLEVGARERAYGEI